MNSYNIPPDVYRITLDTAKRYNALRKRRKEIEQDILYGSSQQKPGGGHGSPGMPTEQKALQLLRRKDRIEKQIKAIEDAFLSLPNKQIRQAVKRNVCDGIRMDDIYTTMSTRTLKRYRKAFLIKLAQNLEEI